MITYKTYQEAKIANPEMEVYLLCDGGGFTSCKDIGEDARFVDLNSDGEKCNPADYCIGVAEFKERGLELSNGDLYELKGTGVFQVGFGDGISVDHNSPANELRYILRAKALEKPKPTRTKVSYEKVTDSIFDLKEEFERGELHSRTYDGIKQEYIYEAIENELELITNTLDNCIYRKVETPITWQDEVDNHFLKTKRLGIDCTIEEAITRSDYCEEFLEVCRVALRANGELTYKA